MSKTLTMVEFAGGDMEIAAKIARALGYRDSTAYTSTSDIIGLFCLPRYQGHRGGCVVKTVEFGFMFMQTDEDMNVRDTIMRLGVRVGNACGQYMDENMRGLSCEKIQIDEMWGFIGKKQKNVTKSDSRELGDVYTFIALDADSKLIPAYLVGKRDMYHASQFLEDLSSRMANRRQLNSVI